MKKTFLFDRFVFLLGGILGLCIVCGLIVLFLCIHQQKRKKISKNGSTDTLKTNSDHFPAQPSVRVSDTNSCLYYPASQTRTLYYNDETTGIYSVQGKETSSFYQMEFWFDCRKEKFRLFRFWYAINDFK